MLKYALSRKNTSDLVDHIYIREQQAIRSHPYRNQKAREEDLLHSQESYEISKQLLASEPKLGDLSPEDPRTLLWETTRSSVRFAHEALINFQLRKQYMGANKIICDGMNSAFMRMDQVLQREPDTLTVLDAWANFYVKEMRKTFNTWSDASSKSWRLSWRRTPSWRTLLDRQADNLRELSYLPITPLESFNREDQVRVFSESYRKLIAEQNYSLALLRRLGAAVSVLTTGAMIWYVLQDDDPGRTAAKSVVSIPPALAAGYAGTEIGLWLGALTGPVGSMLGGIFGGLIGSFVGGLASDYLFDAIVLAFAQDIPDTLKREMFGAPIHYELTLPNTVQLSRDFIAKLS